MFTANFAVANHSGQSFCPWSMKNHRYYSNSWLILFIWLSVCRWNNVDNFVSIPNILLSFFINSTANCDPLSDTILSDNLCNFYILSLNNHNNFSTDVSSIVVTKCIILDNLSHMTKIVSFLATNSNLVIKSTIRCV